MLNVDVSFKMKFFGDIKLIMIGMTRKEKKRCDRLPVVETGVGAGAIQYWQRTAAWFINKESGKSSM